MAPSSISTVSTITNGPVSLPLFKLSHCTTATLRSNMLWTHLPNRDNMFAVFDRVRRRELDGSVRDKKVLKLVRECDLLDEVDLDVLRHQVRLDDERCRSQYIPDELLFVIVIVKKPLLALRYQLPDGQIRRIQLNFMPESGFDVALDTLSSAGLPIRDKHQPQMPLMRPHSSQDAFLSSSQPRSQEYAGFPSKFSQSTDIFTSNFDPATVPTHLPMLLPSPEFHAPLNAFGSREIRPTSAPETQSERATVDSFQLSQMLPPKRELPFPEKKEKSPIQDAETPCSPEAQQPAKKNTTAKAAISKKSAAKTPRPKATKIKAAKGSSLKDKAPSSSAPKFYAKTLLEKEHPENAPSSSAPPSINPPHNPSARAVSPICDDLAPLSSPQTLAASRKGPMSGLSSSASNVRHGQKPNKPSSPTKERQAQLPNPVLLSINAEELLSSVDTWIRKYHDLPAPKPPQTAKDHLAVYAAQSDEDRAKAIDNLICECLQDENFGKLVEDVEGAWRRIGLGF